MQQTKRVQLRARRLVDGVFAGQYHSVFKGRGIEFADVREYVPGDDVRDIDWNVTARTGRPHIKRHIEERELTVILLLDVSASGRFGTTERTKQEQAAEFAAVIAMSALKNNDKVGLLLFTDRVESYLPPMKGRNRAMRVIGELLLAEPRGTGTNVRAAVHYLHNVFRRRALVFLLSDFWDAGYETALRTAHHKHEIIPVCLRDPRELSLDDLGLLSLQDLETGEHLLVDSSSPAVRAEFETAAGTAYESRLRAFRSLGIEPIQLRTDEHYLYPLLRYFQRRERRLAQGR